MIHYSMSVKINNIISAVTFNNGITSVTTSSNNTFGATTAFVNTFFSGLANKISLAIANTLVNSYNFNDTLFTNTIGDSSGFNEVDLAGNISIGGTSTIISMVGNDLNLSSSIPFLVAGFQNPATVPGDPALLPLPLSCSNKIQAGYVNATTAGTSVVFPTAFPNNSVTVTCARSSTITTGTTTGTGTANVTVNSSATNSVNWISIGY